MVSEADILLKERGYVPKVMARLFKIKSMLEFLPLTLCDLQWNK